MRVRVHNPGEPRKKGKTMTAKKKKKPAKKNPKRSSAKRKTAPKKNPSKKRTAKRSSAKNPHHGTKKKTRRKNPRPRRKNPGWGGVKTAFMALAVGTGAAIASSWISDGPLGNQTTTVQTLALVAEAAAAVYYVEDPAIMAAIVVGLGAVQVGHAAYQLFPGLASPAPMGAPAAAPAVAGGATPNALPAAAAAGATVVPITMGALHRRAVRKLRGLDQTMGALHPNLGALHAGIAALHHGDGMGALHPGGGSSIGALHPAGTMTREERRWQTMRRRA